METSSFAIFADALPATIVVLTSRATGAAVLAAVCLKCAGNASLTPPRAAATATSVLLAARTMVIAGLTCLTSNNILIPTIHTLCANARPSVSAVLAGAASSAAERASP